MWRLLHRVFGWDYVYWRSRDYKISGISRIHIDGFGSPYIILKVGLNYDLTDYKIYLQLAPEAPRQFSITWLTCTPRKYNISKGD
jgi:hypothetical protein